MAKNKNESAILRYDIETVTKNFVDKIERDTGVPTFLDENKIKEYIQMIIKERKQ